MLSLRSIGCAALPAVVAVFAVAGPLGAAPNASVASAQRVPAEVGSIAATVAPEGAGDEAKARAIFKWVTSNIAYDPSYYTTGSAKDQTLAQVLATRKSVCFGFASVFEALAKAAGLECVTVQGYSKGYRFTAGDPLAEKPNHAWNAVRVDGTWRLVDCTWGAGYIDESVQFRRSTNEHYLLTPPEEFIYDHFPSDPKWQLLSRPLSRKEFESLLLVRPPFFHAGLRVQGNTAAVIPVGSAFSVALAAPADTLVMARLFQGSQQVGANCTLVQRKQNSVNVLVSPPGPGTFALRIFVKKSGQEGDYHWAAEYRVVSSAASPADPPFPQVFEAFSTRSVELTSPVSGTLKQGAPVGFRLSVPGAQSVAVVEGEDWVFLQRSGTDCSGTVTPRGGPVQVAAMFPGSESYEVLLKYNVR